MPVSPVLRYIFLILFDLYIFYNIFFLLQSVALATPRDIFTAVTAPTIAIHGYKKTSFPNRIREDRRLIVFSAIEITVTFTREIRNSRSANNTKHVCSEIQFYFEQYTFRKKKETNNKTS